MRCSWTSRPRGEDGHAILYCPLTSIPFLFVSGPSSQWEGRISPPVVFRTRTLWGVSGRLPFAGYQGRPPTRFLLLTDWDEPPRPGLVRIPARGARESRWLLGATALGVVFQDRGLCGPCSAARPNRRRTGRQGLWVGGRTAVKAARTPAFLRTLVGTASRSGLWGSKCVLTPQGCHLGKRDLGDGTDGMSPQTGCLW